MCIVILDKCCFKKICVLIYNIFRLVYEEGEVLECGKQPVHSWERERGRRGVETGWTRWREWRVGGQWWWGGGGGGMFTIISSLGQSKPGRMYPGCLVPCCTVLIKKQTSPVWNVCCGGKWCLHHFHQEWDTRKWRHFCCCYVADILCQSTYIIIRDCYKEQKTNVLTIHHVHATHTHTHTHTHTTSTPQLLTLPAVLPYIHYSATIVSTFWTSLLTGVNYFWLLLVRGMFLSLVFLSPSVLCKAHQVFSIGCSSAK